MKKETKILCCSGCGLMMQNNVDDYSIKCPRCFTSVCKKHHKLNYDLSLAIGAFLLFFPAMYLPVLSFKLGSQIQEGNMFFAVEYFFTGGYELLSALLLFTTVLAPLIYIVTAIFMYGALYEQRRPKYMKLYFKILFELKEWVMVDIYIISVLVSIIKLEATSDVIYGPGIVFLAGLAVLSFLLTNAFSPKQVWRAYHNAH